MTTHPLPSRRAVLGGAAAAALAVAAGSGTASATGIPAGWPTEIPLPNGFRPEGITIGRAPYAYLGSLGTGSVYRADLRTGRGTLIYEGTGAPSVGMKVDRDGLLYVSGGSQGSARVIDTRTGRLVAAYQPAATTGHFINDVFLLRDRAWFTDSNDAVLHGVPRGRPGDVRSLPLGGDWQQVPGVFNANGIVDTPDEQGLILVSGGAIGKLYRVDVRTGHATRIVLQGADDVADGDGLFRIGRTLYVVQNRSNLVSVFHLDAGAGTAVLRRRISDARFDVPTTAARFGNRLYLANARFSTPPTPDTTYNAVAVPLR